MYRVFIADDESWILERLVTTIDWQSIGAEVGWQVHEWQRSI